jgi:hypothetical protein
MSQTVTPYLAKVPFPNNQAPNFMAWLQVLLQPMVDLQNLQNTMYLAFDVDVAEGVQLDTVGLWVGVGRAVSVPITAVFFTYDTPGLGYDQGIYIDTYTPSAGITLLDDYHYRFLIYARIAADNWDGTYETATAAYQLVLQGSPGVTVTVQDNGNMTATVTFTGSLTLLQQSLITGGYIPLVPMGVTVSYVFVA